MIATIATIVEIELKSISAIVVATIATIAEEWFPYDRNDRSTFFSAIVAIIWKPAFRGLSYFCQDFVIIIDYSI